MCKKNCNKKDFHIILCISWDIRNELKQIKFFIYNIPFSYIADASNMSEADSAGGGHQGSSPVPPAVTNRRSTITTSNISKQQFHNQEHQIRSASGSAVLLGSAAHHSMTSCSSNDQQRNNNSQDQLQQPRLIETQANQYNYSFATSSCDSSAISTQISSTNPAPSISLSVPGANIENLLPRTSLQSKTLTSDRRSENSELSLSAARKRLRCEVSHRQQQNSSFVETPTVFTTSFINDLNTLKKRILEYKFARLRSIKEKYGFLRYIVFITVN